MAVSKLRLAEGGTTWAACVFHLAHSIYTKARIEFMSAAAKWGVRRANGGAQGCPGVLTFSAILHMPVGEGSKTGRLTSAPYCRVKWRCLPLPRGHPKLGPSTSSPGRT